MLCPMSRSADSGLFGSVRSWAYRNIVHYGDQDSFSRAVDAHARDLNARYFHGRTEDQIRDLALSIAAGIWKRRDLLISGH